MRLLLFDIDGTLVRTNGMGRRALEAAFSELWGWSQATQGFGFGGMTDPLIIETVFRNHGRTVAEAAAAQEELLRRYVEHLERTTAADPARCALLPGVKPLIEALGEREDCLLGVLTGNVEAGARIKLEACGLGSFYRVGAFGDEAPKRTDLLPLALERANRMRDDLALTPGDAVVIGDTPRDIDVARAHGARAVAVATGVSPREDLVAHEPDVLLDDLSALEHVVRELLGAA